MVARRYAVVGVARGGNARLARPPVPEIVSPGKITVKGAPAARRLLRNRRPLSSDLVRKDPAPMPSDGMVRRRATQPMS